MQIAARPSTIELVASHNCRESNSMKEKVQLCIAAGLVLLMLVFGFNSFSSSRNLLNLDWIYEKGQGIGDNHIFFVKTTSGNLLFFSAQSRLKLADVLTAKHTEVRMRVVDYEPTTGVSLNKQVVASKKSEGLVIGDYRIDLIETDRLRIGQEWNSVNAYLTKFRANVGAKHEKMFALEGFNVDKVACRQFLITGGYYAKTASEDDDIDYRRLFTSYSKTARLMDLARGRIIKEIPLQFAWIDNFTVSFPDGKVLLLGGRFAKHFRGYGYPGYGLNFEQATMAEIIDPVSGETRTFPCSLRQVNSYCFDSENRCILVAAENPQIVYRIDVRKQSVEKLGTLKHFTFADQNVSCKQNAILVPSGRFLLCGGTMLDFFGYPHRVAKVEIFDLPD